jgi:hypothetical protein
MWRLIQFILLLAGFALVVTLIYLPETGLDIFWSMLIPVAPALIVIAPGLWRNICPLATFALLSQCLNTSRRTIPTPTQAAWFSVAGVAALLLIVPLRHLSLNTSGPLTALMLVVASICAFVLCMRYERRSAWCNAMCPIYPAEKLYGVMPAISVPNVRCDSCDRCCAPCPDSTRSMSPVKTRSGRVEKIAGHIMAGGFVGFIWGWNQVSDYHVAVEVVDIILAYAWPFGCALVTLVLYSWAWLVFCSPQARRRLIKVFATTAVCVYYWYSMPSLLGFGPHPGFGMLFDLRHQLPDLPLISRALTTSFFIWFMLLRSNPGTSWMKRTSLSI